MRRNGTGFIVLVSLLAGCTASSVSTASPSPTLPPAIPTQTEPTLAPTPTHFVSPTPAPDLVESMHPASLLPLFGQFVILREGHLWTLDPASGEWAALLESGHVSDPAISPDGERIAYLYYSSDPAQDPAPAEVWVDSLADGTVTRLAGVSINAAAGLVRTAPSWSPDGSQLAWGELDPAAHSLAGYQPYYAVVADLASGQAEKVTQIDLPTDIPGPPPPIDWGESGLAYLQPAPWEASFGPPPVLTVVNPRGIIGVNAPINPQYVAYHWVLTPDGQRLALLYGDGSWDLIDAATSTSESFTGGLVMTNPAAAAGPALVVVAHPDPAGLAALDGWLVDMEGQTALLPAGTVSLTESRVAVSADGVVAYLTAEGITLWNDGDPQLIEGTAGTEAIFGGAAVWQSIAADDLLDLGVSSPPPLIQDVACASSSNLQPGGSAQVNALPTTEGVIVWAERAPLHKFLLLLAAGSTFSVLDGPFCTDWELGPVVWKVSVRGTEGYIAEPLPEQEALPLFQTVQP